MPIVFAPLRGTLRRGATVSGASSEADVDLHEVFMRIGGEQKYLWRAVDEHGQVLDILLQDHRDTDAAERFFRRLLGGMSNKTHFLLRNM